MSKKDIDPRPHFFREDGQKVYIQSISMVELEKSEEGIRKEFLERGEPIEPPTYTVKTVGKGSVELPMDETNLEVEGDEEETKKRKEAWFKHVQALARMKIETGQIANEIILEGVLVPEGEPSEEWIRKRRRRHIEIPEDPDELLMLYKMTEILKTPHDLLEAEKHIMILSSSGSLKPEDLAAAEESFQSALQAALGRPAKEMEDTSGNDGGSPKEPLDAQHPAKRTKRGKRVVRTAAKPDGAVQTGGEPADDDRDSGNEAEHAGSG